MNHSLTKEQTARVFAMYIWCEVIAPNLSEDDGSTLLGRLTGIHEGVQAEVQHIENGNAWEEPAYHDFKDTKLILRHLSEIRDEDLGEFSETLNSKSLRNSCDPLFNMVDGYIRYYSTQTFIFQHLIQKGYAVPLFIAPNHPDNGKTAIEMGLAIEAGTLEKSQS